MPDEPEELAHPTSGDLHGIIAAVADAARAAHDDADRDRLEDPVSFDAWATEQIPLVARMHFDQWRRADRIAVEAIDHMATNVPDHSREVETRLTGIAMEVRYAFHQARTGLDLIENPSPATLRAFMRQAHHEDTPDLLKAAPPQQVPATVIADSAALSANFHDTIDALEHAVSALAHEEAAQVRTAQSLTPANGNGEHLALPLHVDDRPTFAHLTDARLDDIDTILHDARSNDNRLNAPVAVVLTAAAAQTFHRVAGLDVMDADTSEHERAAETTREDVNSLIAIVADAREVHLTGPEFASVEAQDAAEHAAMLAPASSPEASSPAEAVHPFTAALMADTAEGEMTDARWTRAQVQDLLDRMNEMSDYKAEATEKNASRERYSGRDDGAER